jgi:arylsulfatase A-like enzyme
MMSGLWPHAHGAISFGKGYETVKPGVGLVIDRLHDAGYRVAYEGVWHINRAPAEDRSKEYAYFRQRNFPYREHAEAFSVQGGRDGDQYAKVRTPKDDGTLHEWRFSVPVPATWTRAIEEHPDMVSARAVAEFIRSAPAGVPIAAWCSLGGPHPPLLVPDPYMSMFSPGQMSPPPSWGEEMSELPKAISDAPGRQAVRNWTWPEWARATAAYWGYVAFLDACLGILLDALRESGRAEDTLVVASCDHGEMLGAHNLYQKSVLYDEAIRLPMVIAGPGVIAGRRSQLASQVDLAPTLLDFLGLPPRAAQGDSLSPLLRDPNAPGRDCAFSEFNGNIEGGVHIRGVMTQQYKYVYHHTDREQLFDCERDPNELQNLSNAPAFAQVKEQLRSQLQSWMERTGDFLRLDPST